MSIFSTTTAALEKIDKLLESPHLEVVYIQSIGILGKKRLCTARFHLKHLKREGTAKNYQLSQDEEE
jgi:hypothetical protein